MNPSPKISVLLSVYNGERYLAEAIDSILSQTYQDFEFLIIDDGSTDSSKTLAEAYAKKDARIRVLHQTNQGLTKALNRGLLEARGEFIARQDADDVSVRTRLEDSLQAIGTAAILMSGWINQGPQGKALSFFSKFLLAKQIWVLRTVDRFFNPYVHGTYFFRRDLALKIGGYREKFRFAQDYDLFLRLSRLGKVAFLPQITYVLRLHEKSLSQANRTSQFACSLLAALENICGMPAGEERDVEKQVSQILRRNPFRALPVFLAQLLRYRDASCTRFALGLLSRCPAKGDQQAPLR